MKLSELLQHLLSIVHLIDSHKCGICELKWHTLYLYDEDLKNLNRYIKSNIPFSRRCYALWNSGYWWKPGKVKPRKKWLEKHIKKLKSKGL